MKTLIIAAAALSLAGCGEAADTSAGTAAATPATGGNLIVPAAAPGARDWTTTVVETPEGGMRMGNPDARVKIVEFASMTCSHCADFVEASSATLESKYIRSGQVSLEFRNFVRDPIDVVASLLARCGGPGPFFKVTEQMFGEQDAIIRTAQARAADMQAADALPGQQTFVRYAEITGLDKFVGMRGIPAAKANACLTDQAALNKLVEMNNAAATQYKLPGTPTFLINGSIVPNVSEWKTLEPKIVEALAA